MCYDVQVGHERLIKDGIHSGASSEQINKLIDDYNEKFNPAFPLPNVYHHVSAFTHPEIGVIHKQGGELVIEPMTWGLIPFWVKDRALANKLWNQTPNARAETMFEKPSYRAAARKRRGIIVINSFYEHHHFSGKAYPFNVRYKKGESMVVAVLHEEWKDKETEEVVKSFSIVTTGGNELMSVIHNNPKLKEPRMPVFLEGEAINEWLGTPESSDSHLTLLPLCKPLLSEELTAYPVKPLRGKNALGNIPEAAEQYEYPELVLDTELVDILS